MARKKQEVQIQVSLKNNEEWNKFLERPGLLVIDVYSEWCGPCEAMQPFVKKLRIELGDEQGLHFATANCDQITDLAVYKSCEPVWLIMSGKVVMKEMIGNDAPKFLNLVRRLHEEEKKIEAGEMERVAQYPRIPEAPPEEEVKADEKDELLDRSSDREMSFLEPYVFVCLCPSVYTDKLLNKMIETIEAKGFKIVELKHRYFNDADVAFLYNFHEGLAPDQLELIMTQYIDCGPTYLAVLKYLNKESSIKAWNTLVGPEIEYRTGEEEEAALEAKKRAAKKKEMAKKRKKAGDNNAMTLRKMFDRDSQFMSVIWSHPDKKIHNEMIRSFFYTVWKSVTPVVITRYTKFTSTEDITRLHAPLMLLPQVMLARRLIEEFIRDSGYFIVTNKKLTPSLGEVMQLFEENVEIDDKTFEDVTRSIADSFAVIMIIKSIDGKDIQGHLADLIGPSNVEVAKEKFPDSLRATYGVSGHYSGFWYTPSISKQVAFMDKYIPEFKTNMEASLKKYKLTYLAVIPLGLDRKLYIFERLVELFCDIIASQEIMNMSEEKIEQLTSILKHYHTQEDIENLQFHLARGLPTFCVVYDCPYDSQITTVMPEREKPVLVTKRKREIQFFFPDLMIDESLAASRTSIVNLVREEELLAEQLKAKKAQPKAKKK